MMRDWFYSMQQPEAGVVYG